MINAGFDPLAPEVLFRVLVLFSPTLLAEIAVVALSIRRRWLSAREGELAHRLREQATRVYSGRSLLEGEAASLWSVPLLVWALQAVWVMRSALITSFLGLVNPGPEYVWEALYSTGLALVALVCLQALAVQLVEGWRTGHLGLVGPWRVAVQYAIASAVLVSFLHITDFGVFWQ